MEEPYTVREARIHVCHIHDLFKSVDPTDAYNGSDCASLSFLNTVCQGDAEKKRTRTEAVDCTPPDFILPIGPQLDHTINAFRAEDASSSKLGYEEHIPGQTRNWNKEMHTTRELLRKKLPEKTSQRKSHLQYSLRLCVRFHEGSHLNH